MPSQKLKEPQDLLQAMEAVHRDYLDYQDTKKRFMREFTGGVVRGLGMAIGGTIVFGLVAFILGKFLIIPGAENFLDELKNQASEFRGNYGEPTN